mmetsp:Transcript_43398/g.60268  ORF Transcript_43398/g.60268 Transcript_43398/m.60268 type:complete len:90 (-) Transcript_43398:81-350(-)
MLRSYESYMSAELRLCARNTSDQPNCTSLCCGLQLNITAGRARVAAHFEGCPAIAQVDPGTLGTAPCSSSCPSVRRTSAAHQGRSSPRL